MILFKLFFVLAASWVVAIAYEFSNFFLSVFDALTEVDAGHLKSTYVFSSHLLLHMIVHLMTDSNLIYTVRKTSLCHTILYTTLLVPYHTIYHTTSY
jgi:hypothetical protein